jgi:hypothetical protein
MSAMYYNHEHKFKIEESNTRQRPTINLTYNHALNMPLKLPGKRKATFCILLLSVVLCMNDSCPKEGSECKEDTEQAAALPTSNSTADESLLCTACVPEAPSTPTSRHCYIGLSPPSCVSTAEPPFR